MKASMWTIAGVVVLGVILASIISVEGGYLMDDELDRVKALIVPVLDSVNLDEGISGLNPLKSKTWVQPYTNEHIAWEQEHFGTSIADETPVENVLAYVSFSFDDNIPEHLSVIAPILAEHNMRATRYYITGQPNYTECKVLRDVYGWEIGAHTRTHPDLTAIPIELVYAELQGCKEDFAENGIDVKTFAAPYVETNQNVTEVVKRFFNSSRSSWGVNYPPFDPYHIGLYSINNRDNPHIPTILAVIDSLKESHGWIVFMGHHVDYTGNDYSTDESFFRDLVRLVAEDHELKVVTISEALEEGLSA